MAKEKTHVNTGLRLVNRDDVNGAFRTFVQSKAFADAARRAAWPRWLHWLVCR